MANESIVAWTPFVAVIVAACVPLYAARAQIKASRDVAGLQLFLQLVQKYDGELHDTRERLGMLLCGGGSNAPVQDQETVLDFFETIGYLMRRKLIDRHLVLSEFSIPVQCYWNALAPYVHEARARYDDDDSVYEETEWLYKFILAQERRRRHNPAYTITKEAREQFFRTETSAVIPPIKARQNEAEES
ncbi:MAG: DUF4760 domain-containing protein [Acidiferrobacteraceae bacterium]